MSRTRFEPHASKIQAKGTNKQARCLSGETENEDGMSQVARDKFVIQTAGTGANR